MRLFATGMTRRQPIDGLFGELAERRDLAAETESSGASPVGASSSSA